MQSAIICDKKSRINKTNKILILLFDNRSHENSHGLKRHEKRALSVSHLLNPTMKDSLQLFLT
ncbi:hypothetical protein J27TS8_43300 [Robertmurraya siralis]|uniref:Uncharacterized protein n=1 Tax=Robertmurraya siralis TaxID=77777 RepID=A0A919WMB2_9BACI|nr:hypothetical protein [Robertmurraya siralis]GIN64337.1 hypothetical protein J27TS8_43300 [Robertmurraya siralis]